MGISTDELLVPAAKPAPPGARWVEAARTELGQLGAMIDGGFAAKKRPTSVTATAETAFLLAIDASEKETDGKDATPPRALPRMARPAARPAEPIAGDTEPRTPPAARPRLSIGPEAVRAILSQPTAMLARSCDPDALQRITIGPIGPAGSATDKSRPKSFVQTPRARKSSFVGRLGVAVAEPRSSRPPPPAQSASGHRVMVVSSSPRARAWNMAAAVMSGLAAAMAVMAVVVSI